MEVRKKSLRFIDLFLWNWRISPSLEGCGHSCVFSSDWDKDARLTYRENYGESPFGDLTEAKVEEIPTHDVLCAGFPANLFSISGNQVGFADARGTLLYEIIRVARHHRPRALFLENVKNYLGHDSGRTLETTLGLLDKEGYRVYYNVLNASRFGVPQKRERIYFVCLRKDLELSEFQFPEPTDECIALEELLLPSDDPRLEDLIIELGSALELRIASAKENRPLRIGTVGKGGQGERVYSPKGHAITLSAYGGRHRRQNGDVFRGWASKAASSG